MKISNGIGKTVALALLSVSLANCGNNAVDPDALGAPGSDVRAFYDARESKPAWDDKSEKQLLDVINGAAAQGLRPDLFLKGDLPKDKSEREVALTKAALRYASALAEGYSDPKKVSKIYTIPRAKTDVAAGLAKAVQDRNLAGWYASLPPQTDEYRALAEAFATYAKDSANPQSAEKARQIAVNMERLRWLERNPPATRIDVNTGAATLEYWRDGALRDKRNVVVGQPDWETPQLGSPIFQLVAHPYWRVPKSILDDELSKKSPAYLAEQGMEWRDGKLVQLPGPKNSLGDVKFDMRNDNAIYLHDTPAKALFGMPQRHRSHGCVRVQDALGFAMLLAQDDGILASFKEKMMKPDEEGFVKLRKEVPVRLMYRTAFLKDGTVELVNDIYDWDDEVAYALGYVRKPPRTKIKQEGGDVGP